MADGIVFTGDTGIAIDNSLVGTTAYRQRIVIGRDGTSSGFANPSTVWPSSDTMGLPVRVIGSSGIVLGMVAPSSNWTVSATVAATTTLNLGPSTELIGRISSGTQTIGTVVLSSGLGASTAIIGSLSSGTAQIGILGPSSANVIGTVAQSSNWNISTGAIVGLTTTSVVGLTTTSIVNLSSALANYVTNSTTVPVYLSTGQIINLSSAITNYVTNSTTVPVYLGVSSGNVIGQVAPSSQWTVTTSVVNATSGMVQLSSGTAQFGSLGPSSGNVIGLVAPSSDWTVVASVAATTTLNLGASTELIGRISSGTQTIGTVVLSSGLGASTAIIGSLSSGTAQIGILGPSSANVIGMVAQSSNWNLSTAAIVNLSSAITNYVTNSTTVPVYLGASTSNIVGAVSQSSAFALSSGSAYVGTVVNASSGLVYFSTTTTVGITTGLNSITSQTTAGGVGSSAVFVGGGVVATTANTNTLQSSGTIQMFQVDRSGALTVNLEGPRQLIRTTSLLTAANTSFQQIIAAPGAGVVCDITLVHIWSTGSNILSLLSSSGSTAAAWTFPLQSSGADWNKFYNFNIPIPQPSANIAWGVYSTVAARVMLQYVLGTS